MARALKAVSAHVRAVSTQVLGRLALNSSRNSQVGASAGMAETVEYGGSLVVWFCRQSRTQRLNQVHKERTGRRVAAG
jgi:hypothetical protein